MINKAKSPYYKYKVLISQPEPSHPSSPYLRLANTQNLDLDFRKFVKVIPVSGEEFQKYQVIIPQHTALIFTSRSAIDHFFSLCKESKIEINPNMKYFCISEQTANYLQKYIQLKKRKVFVGGRTAEDLYPLFKKHNTEKYLFPCSEEKNIKICSFFENQLNLSSLIVYKIVSNNLTDLDINAYDVITFFTPADVSAFLDNFENFTQKNSAFATFGNNTSKLLKEYGYESKIHAPTTAAPSMVRAIEIFLSNKMK
ncbi:MAG: uroporphyrinogen-III synthase [Bacteroidetes bacterium]|nr:uroporphyrinogen-III synthase [Bacteroidota bacterium]